MRQTPEPAGTMANRNTGAPRVKSTRCECCHGATHRRGGPAGPRISPRLATIVPVTCRLRLWRVVSPRVTFEVEAATRLGEVVYVVGNSAALGTCEATSCCPRSFASGGVRQRVARRVRSALRVLRSPCATDCLWVHSCVGGVACGSDRLPHCTTRVCATARMRREREHQQGRAAQHHSQ